MQLAYDDDGHDVDGTSKVPTQGYNVFAAVTQSGEERLLRGGKCRAQQPDRSARGGTCGPRCRVCADLGRASCSSCRVRRNCHRRWRHEPWQHLLPGELCAELRNSVPREVGHASLLAAVVRAHVRSRCPGPCLRPPNRADGGGGAASGSIMMCPWAARLGPLRCLALHDPAC